MEVCWFARELSKILEYKDFRNFELTITKAMEACKNSGYQISDHIGEFTGMVSIGPGVQRGIMPEDLPTPSKSIKQIEREQVKKEIK